MINLSKGYLKSGDCPGCDYLGKPFEFRNIRILTCPKCGFKKFVMDLEVHVK